MSERKLLNQMAAKQELYKKLPIDAFPLQDLDLERTGLYKINSDHKGEGLRILTGFRDPGAAATLIPVIKRLTEDSTDISILADSRAKQALEASGLDLIQLENNDPLLSTAEEADVIFTGFSNHPGTELALTANGRLNGIPVVWIEDYPGGLFDHYRNKLRTVDWVIPDYIYVVSEYGKQQELKHEPSFDPDKIIVTGQPAHDRFAEENREATRDEMRNALGISDKTKLITYMGIPQLASAEALKLLLKGLTSLDLSDYKFVLRRHPRDTTLPDEYQQLMSSILDKVVDTSQFKTDQVGIASDLVVTTMSSTGMDAVYRGIPSIHILVPDILANSEVGSDFATPDMVTDGASVGIFSEDEMLPALHNLFFNSSFTKDLREKMNRFKPESGATERVAELILQLAKEHKKS